MCCHHQPEPGSRICRIQDLGCGHRHIQALVTGVKGRHTMYKGVPVRLCSFSPCSRATAQTMLISRGHQPLFSYTACQSMR